MNCAAIGTMYPGIEIWDLDCRCRRAGDDAGGYSEEAIKTAGKKNKKGKKSSKALKVDHTKTPSWASS